MEENNRSRAEMQLEKIAEQMGQMVRNAKRQQFTTAESYLMKFEECAAEYDVPFRNENGAFREPKAVIFDLIMHVNWELQGYGGAHGDTR